MNHSILVTGADGFIGSHLTEALVRAGHTVRAFVFYNSFGSRGWLDSCQEDVKGEFEIYAGDIRDSNAVKKAVDGCDVVMHLAALIGIPYSYQSPQSYIATNVIGTLNVAQAAHDSNVFKLIVTSTSEVYGTAKFVPISEEHPLQAQSPYSASKIGADHIALSFHSSFKTPIAVLRPFNTYGPRQSARAVIPTIITQIASGRRTLKLGALTPTRDFSFVTDTTAAFVKAINCDAIIGTATNLGSGFEVSIAETARIIAKLMNVDIDIECEAQRLRPDLSEVERLVADTAKAQRLIGWAPEHTGLDGLKRGLAKTIDWFTDPPNLTRYRADEYAV